MSEFPDFLKDREKIKIIAKPNSSKTEIIGYDQEKSALRLNVKAPPEENKANIEIIRFFKKLLKKDVKIIYGLKDKEKIIRIE
ncbi:MAG: DUF167 domain-containing protein [Candidatus Woesearchaeota archaeon]|nr:DUF167 domain-containing protein [Candidatus Woesearchaeota archaeon]